MVVVILDMFLFVYWHAVLFFIFKCFMSYSKVQKIYMYNLKNNLKQTHV